MTRFDQLIDDLIQKEGRKETNRKNDSGGRTKYGISEKYHPLEWKNGPPTEERAREIYFHQYIINPGFHKIQPLYLMEQLVDFGVPSGPQTAIMHLQRILGFTGKDVDGELGPKTLAALAKRDPKIVNNKLVDSRLLMFARIVVKRPKDLENLIGWMNRALSFRME